MKANLTTSVYQNQTITLNEDDVLSIYAYNYGTADATIEFNGYARKLTPLDGKGLPTAEFRIDLSGVPFDLRNLKIKAPLGAKVMVDIAAVQKSC